MPKETDAADAAPKTDETAATVGDAAEPAKVESGEPDDAEAAEHEAALRDHFADTLGLELSALDLRLREHGHSVKEAIAGWAKHAFGVDVR